jgi:hypothetical protein
MLKRTNLIQYVDTLISGSGSSIGWYQVISSPLGAGYVAADYVAYGTLIGNPASVITANRHLTAGEQTINAQYILDYMVGNLGWTRQAVCGLLGNIEVESTMSPGAWFGFTSSPTTGLGFGLTQWTPSTKYLN